MDLVKVLLKRMLKDKGYTFILFFNVVLCKQKIKNMTVLGMGVWGLIGIIGSAIVSIWAIMKFIVSQNFRLDDNLSKILIEDILSLLILTFIITPCFVISVFRCNVLSMFHRYLYQPNLMLVLQD